MATARELRALMAAAAVGALLFLPLTSGCARGRRAAAPPREAPAAEAPPSPDIAAALAHFSAAVALDLRADHLEELFAYQSLSLGNKQPSLLRDSRRLRYSALDQLDEALKLDPRSPVVLRRKGDVLLRLNRIDSAVKLYREAEAIAPADPRWYFHAVGQLEILDRPADAASLLHVVASGKAGAPDDMRAIAAVELASLYVRLERLADAEKACRLALELLAARPSEPPSHVARALASTLEDDPTAIRRMLISILRRLNRLDDALEEAQTLAREQPHEVRAVLALSHLYEARGEDRQALSVIEDFANAHPASRDAILALMNVLVTTGRADDSAERGKAFLSSHGPDERVAQEIMSVYSRAGRPAGAEEFALSLDDGTGLPLPVALALLDVYAKAKRTEDAFAVCEKALRRYSSDNRAAQELLQALWSRFGAAEADRFYGAYSSRYPDDFNASYAYARMLRSKGETEKSGDIFVSLAQRDAPYTDLYDAAAGRLLATGDPYAAMNVVLKGIERGFFSQPDAVASRVLESASDPAALAARLETDLPKYNIAQYALQGMIARLYARAGDNPKAEEHYRKALESPAPGIADYAGLVVSLYRQDKTSEAIDLLNTLRKQGQGAPPLLRMLVTMLARDGRFDDARALALDLVREQPTSVDNRLALATLYVEEENYEAALPELLAARDLAEGEEEMTGEVRYMLGIVYEEQGNYDLALSMWRANLAADPADPDSSNAIAYHIAEYGGDFTDALALVEKALSLQPDNGAYLDTLGWIHYKMGDMRAALEALRKAASEEHDPVVFNHLGDALLATGDAAGALEAWNKALSLQPKRKDRAAIEEKIRASSPE